MMPATAPPARLYQPYQAYPSSPPSPISPSPSACWTYEPAFGIVHLSGCRVCSHYRRHLAAASASASSLSVHGTGIGFDSDPSFREALKERDYQQNALYLRGIDEGTCLQKELDRRGPLNTDHDGGLAERYFQVKELARVRAEELARTKEELRQVKAQFEALKELFDEVVDFNSVWEDVGDTTEEWVAEDFAGDVLRMEEGVFLDGQYRVEDQTGFLDGSTYSPFQLPSPPRTPESPPAAYLPSSDSLEEIFGEEETLATPFDDELHATSSSSSSNANEDDQHQNDLIRDDTLMTIEELAQLMEEARNIENIQALTRVRAFSTRAQRTPRGKRTKQQDFVLHHWRGPVSPPTSKQDEVFFSSPLPSPPPSPRLVSLPVHPEIFVDASYWGIGFVLNGRWLAWRLKPGWNSSGRDISWSEMVAVELGLRVLITSGLRSTTLTVRSDNAGVVQALKTGRSKHEQQVAILRNVLHLANEYEIDVKPVWVASKDNLADGYSRGEAGPKALVFPKVPAIPPYLEAFMELCMPEGTTFSS